MLGGAAAFMITGCEPFCSSLLEQAVSASDIIARAAPVFTLMAENRD
jgi:hypothetical protein